MRFSRLTYAAFCLIAVSQAVAQSKSPFAPPQASLHYALDRTCDLQHVEADIEVDYENRTYSGKSVNTLVPLRSGITKIDLMAGQSMQVKSVSVDGKSVNFKRFERQLTIETGPLTKGKAFKVEVVYNAKNSKARPFGGGGGGFHWIEPSTTIKDHVGFWTQGETETNSEWIPTWDYPNDLTTSQIRCTVQADWDMIGNGRLTKKTLSPDKKKKTFEWTMTQPHATYLLTMVGGPLDIKKDKWQGVDLWYVVPRGQAYLIDSSFGHTKDMLTFFSDKLGVKYPWPKYAQLAMYDFGGGMENVSATTLGEGSLTDFRGGYYRMDSLNSHELGHQWFGDLVTCMHWGDAWLNESFATFMEMIYLQHSVGENTYQWEVEDNMRAYFQEAKRYKRPISTKMYPNGDAMFDSHTYPKGGVVLHTLRQKLGDEAFFGSLKAYLTQWRHTPVESSQLRRSFTESTGINAEPFWAQWFEAPGHPVLDYSYVVEGGMLKLTVKQLQDTSDGTPTYDIDAKIGLIGEDGKVALAPLHLSKKEQTFEWPMMSAPKALILDPNHEFLREIPKLNWSESELPWILKYAPNAPDRQEALRQLLAKPTPENVALATQVATDDKGQGLVFRNLGPLVELADPNLRAFWTAQLNHVNFDRRIVAVNALSKLPADPATIATLRGFINDKAPIGVVVTSINALATWDKAANADVFTKALTIKDKRGRIKAAAEKALAK